MRTLDLAVEFATLGEYGVEDVELDAPDRPITWDWPPRCGGRSRPARLPRLPGRGGAGLCPA